MFKLIEEIKKDLHSLKYAKEFDQEGLFDIFLEKKKKLKNNIQKLKDLKSLLIDPNNIKQKNPRYILPSIQTGGYFWKNRNKIYNTKEDPIPKRLNELMQKTSYKDINFISAKGTPVWYNRRKFPYFSKSKPSFELPEIKGELEHKPLDYGDYFYKTRDEIISETSSIYFKTKKLKNLIELELNKEDNIDKLNSEVENLISNKQSGGAYKIFFGGQDQVVVGNRVVDEITEYNNTEDNNLVTRNIEPNSENNIDRIHGDDTLKLLEKYNNILNIIKKSRIVYKKIILVELRKIYNLESIIEDYKDILTQ